MAPIDRHRYEAPGIVHECDGRACDLALRLAEVRGPCDRCGAKRWELRANGVLRCGECANELDPLAVMQEFIRERDAGVYDDDADDALRQRIRERIAADPSEVLRLIACVDAMESPVTMGRD